jgi:putative membrane protein
MLRLIINTLVLLFTIYILHSVGMGITIASFWWALLAALVLGLLNTLLRPLLVLLTLPITFLTLGLFSFGLNGFLFWLVGIILQVGFFIADFWTALAASLVFTALSVLLSRIFGRSVSS